MSFRIQPPAPARPNRCQLFGPGSRVALFEKMAASAADVINLDLEDSVAPSDKDVARANVIEALNTQDWGILMMFVAPFAVYGLIRLGRRLAEWAGVGPPPPTY